MSVPELRGSHATISPPAVRGKRLRNGKKHSASPSQSQSDDGVDLAPVKISASQLPRLSQIPAGSQIVDLTFSSSPEKPQSDGEYQAPRMRGAKKATKKTKARATRGQSTGSVSIDDGEGEEEVSAGIGKRRYLTTKKWSRSHA
jgi:hypothetical protein